MTHSDRPDRAKQTARDIDDLVADFATRLDSLVTAWEQSIVDQRRAQPATSTTPARSATDVFTELDHTMRNVELHWAEHRRTVEERLKEAREWEERAMESIRSGRDDLARQALTHYQECATAVEVATTEADALEAVCDSYRHALVAVRATIGPEERPA